MQIKNNERFIAVCEGMQDKAVYLCANVFIHAQFTTGYDWLGITQEDHPRLKIAHSSYIKRVNKLFLQLQCYYFSTTK